MWFVFVLFLIASPSASPATFDEAYRAGLTALQHNDLEAAKSNLESAARLQPNNGRVWVALAQTYWKLQQPGAAETAASKAFHFSPKDPLVTQSLGIYYSEAAQSLLLKEDFTGAVAVLRQAAGKLKQDPQVELMLGVSYYGLRRFNEAAEAFLSTIALSPDTAQPYIFLGRMLDQIPERLPEVTKLFAAFEKTHPSNYLGYFLHAKALNAQFLEPEAARQLLQRSIALSDHDAAAHFELGMLLDRMHRFSDAAEELERAASLDPSDPATHYRLARLYDRLNKPEQAAIERERHAKLTQAQDSAR